MRCPQCGEIIATGSLCDVESTDCITVSGDGDEGSEFELDFDLSADSDQLATKSAAGLLVDLPAWLTDPPYCQVFSSVNIAISNDTLTAVSFNAERIDTHAMHSPSSNPTRVTIPVGGDGDYVVNFVCAFAPHLTGDRFIQIRKNGSTLYPPVSKPTSGTSGPGDADMECGLTVEIEDTFVAGDYLEALVRQTSGGTLTLISESYSPVLTVANMPGT